MLLSRRPRASQPAGPSWDWGPWAPQRASERPRSLSAPRCLLGRYSPENHQVSSSSGDWTEWSPASLATEKWECSTHESVTFLKKWSDTFYSQSVLSPLLWPWWWEARGPWRCRTLASPARPATQPAQRRPWRGGGGAASSVEGYLAAEPTSRRWSEVPGSAGEQSLGVRSARQDLTASRTWDVTENLTMSPPWTPLPRRLGAYSARSTALSHSITRWLDHCTTSEGEGWDCEVEIKKYQTGAQN